MAEVIDDKLQPTPDLEHKFEINNSDYTILVVDDVMSNVLLLKILLKNEKYNTLTANSGEQAITVAEQEKPDLILLDVMMPGMDGWETCRRLKSNPDTADIPVFFLTALNSTNDIVQGFKLGAADFVTKPINKEELIARVAHEIQLVAAKRQLAEKNLELQHTIKGRDKMYSVIAHDLRSPLGTVKMVLDMLGMMLPEDLIGAENHELLSQAAKQTDELFSLLDNLLKWTKSQTGRLNVVLQDRATDDFIPSIVDLFDKVASTKGISLVYDKEHSDNMVAHCDVDMIKTVIRNFISNAIKFSPTNTTITIRTNHYSSDGNDGFAPGRYSKISVIDQGCGISEENIKKLFHKDTHFTTWGTANEEGSGLGLMLCKDFAVRNGGDVRIESEVGKGSTFSIIIPVCETCPL